MLYEVKENGLWNLFPNVRKCKVKKKVNFVKLITVKHHHKNNSLNSSMFSYKVNKVILEDFKVKFVVRWCCQNICLYIFQEAHILTYLGDRFSIEL
jgi:hypothetical protein